MEYSPTDTTYQQDRILSIDHIEQDSPQSQRLRAVLNNYDDNFGTSDFRGFKITLNYGLATGSVLSIDAYADNGDSKTRATCLQSKSDGDLIAIADSTNYNGVWTIEQTTANTFVIATPFVGDDGASTGIEHEYSPCSPLYVVETYFHSSPGILTLTLDCAGIPDLLAEDRASQEYTQDENSTYTVKDLLTSVVELTGPLFPLYWRSKSFTATFDSEDYLLDTFIAATAFVIPLNRSRLEVIEDLLQYTKTKMRVEDDGAVHFFVPLSEGLPWAASHAYKPKDYVKPSAAVYHINWAFECTTAGTSGATEPDPWTAADGGTTNDGTVVWTTREFDYTYESMQSGMHEMFSWNDERKLVMPNRIVVSNHPDEDNDYEGSAEDTDCSDLTDMEKTEYHWLPVTSVDQANRLAESILETYRRNGRTGLITVPMNIGQEVHDYIEATDYRHGSADGLRGNVGTLRRIVGGGNWYMEITFGKAGHGVVPAPPDIELAVVEETGVLPVTLDPATHNALVFVQHEASEARKRLTDALEPILNSYNLRHRLATGQILLLQQQVEELGRLYEDMRLLLASTLGAYSMGKATISSVVVPLRMQIPVGTDKFG